MNAPVPTTCMFACMHICVTHERVHACPHVRMGARACRKHGCMDECTRVCTYISMDANIHVQIYSCMHSTHVCTPRMHVHMHARVQAGTHTCADLAMYNIGGMTTCIDACMYICVVVDTLSYTSMLACRDVFMNAHVRGA